MQANFLLEQIILKLTAGTNDNCFQPIGRTDLDRMLVWKSVGFEKHVPSRKCTLKIYLNKKFTSRGDTKFIHMSDIKRNENRR